MATRYLTGVPELDDALTGYLDEHAPPGHADLIREMIGTTLKLIRDQTGRGDLKIINSALKEMRYSFKVLRPYNRVRKVSVFGSARTSEETPEYRQALEFCREMAARGFMTLTGAGPGIMKAGNEGAGRDMSFGLNIKLPFEQTANSAIVDDPKLVNFKYFFTRKLAFLKDSHAIVMFPGGYGTHDEAFESLTLVQTGKSHLVPIVFVHPPGSEFWSDWDAYIHEHLLGRKLISPEDLSLYRITDDLRCACDEITDFYRRFHSMRYVRDELVVRLEAPLLPEELEELNDRFSDLVLSGRIEATSALPPEADDLPIAHLPRLKFRFARRRYGRLREFVDALNRLPLPEGCQVEVPEAGEGGLIPEEVDPQDPLTPIDNLSTGRPS
jgi:uncharacterized protein (TIGR00730 family)